MADKKQPYNWASVTPGDIISFRYKSKSGKVRVQTIMVLNPKLPVSLKNGKKTKHLIGIKLEENNKIKLRLTSKQVTILEKIGTLKPIDEDNNLYKLDIQERFVLNDIKGVKPRAYQILSRSIGIKGKYRTYDFYKAKRSAVYLDPIRLFTKLDEAPEREPGTYWSETISGRRMWNAMNKKGKMPEQLWEDKWEMYDADTDEMTIQYGEKWAENWAAGRGKEYSPRER